MSDVAAATAFYGAVLGWSFVDTGPDFGHYQIAQTSGHAAAAIGPLMEEGQPTTWTVYLASDDADSTAKLIGENGGRVLGGPMDIPGAGRMVVALDSVGGAFGVWQSLGMIGTEIVNEPGSLVWTDARLSDPGAGRNFYSAVFGYDYAPVPGAPSDYSTFTLDGEVRGGMMGGPPGAPSHWLPWFSVADHGAAWTAATDADSAVLISAEDGPFGRMGILTDPLGASFGLHSAPAGS